MKNYRLWVFGPAAVALSVGVLVPPAVSQARDQWDIGAYDRCLKAAEDRLFATDDVQRYYDERVFCCQMSGGVWSGDKSSGKCEAPPATAQSWPQAPWEANRTQPETAAPGQNPETPSWGSGQVVPTGPGGPTLYTP
ncbi:MAG: hypothetical protein K2X52_10665 [Mycobacteriaceae bacterium]|nr:hypothetical protein [Mycobacteriaceae bacterium]